MEPIVSKRHSFKFYFSLFWGVFFFMILGIGLSIFYNNKANTGQLKIIDRPIPILSAACFVFAGYILSCYIKNSPKITVDENFISFNKEIYSLTDIEKVDLTGIKPFRLVIKHPMEAATVTFKNGDVKYIFHDMYSNSWKIKSFLKQVVIDKNNCFKADELFIDKCAVNSELYETFKGNQIISFRGICLWGVNGFFLYINFTDGRPFTLLGALSLLILCSFMFFVFSYQMSYFQVSDKYLLIRNHNFFWVKTAYKIKNLEKISFETAGKMPNCLRVITKDFRNELYLAGTLSDKTWLQLKDKLETYNITVENTCIA